MGISKHHNVHLKYIQFYFLKMVAASLGIRFVFKVAKREKGSVHCDNPYSSGQRSTGIPIRPLCVSHSSDLCPIATLGMKGALGAQNLAGHPASLNKIRLLSITKREELLGRQLTVAATPCAQH